MKESRFLEFKLEVSNSFLKTVSAFSNIGTGIIRFGVDDEGKAVGISNLKETCLDIENKINDSITPNPNYKLEINEKDKTVDLIVYEGPNKPYFYKSKSYKRNDSSTIEMDIVELKRIILLGESRYFDSLENNQTKPTFSIFAEKMKSILNIDLNDAILKTLGLINNDSYTNAAMIIADKNSFPGIDIIRFGDSINEILDRETIQNVSIFEQYDRSIEIYKKYYQYEKIDGIQRKTVEIIPENAFREAVANALIHRTRDDTPNIRILMYKDKISVISPGDLPSNISKEEYLNGQVSKLRNPTLANIFFRLRYIEMFGTGILRIKELYSSSSFKPDFVINENSITVTLPSLFKRYILTSDEEKVMTFLQKGIEASSTELADFTGFNKSKILRVLKTLIKKEYVKVSGAGNSTKYYI